MKLRLAPSEFGTNVIIFLDKRQDTWSLFPRAQAKGVWGARNMTPGSYTVDKLWFISGCCAESAASLQRARIE
jgi:hypothetical protein